MNIEAPLTVACDESGNDGENLLAGSCPVFAHASVTVSKEQAAEIMDEVRDRTRGRSVELKSKTLLQPRHETTAQWLLEHPALANAASLHLTHKRYFLVAKLFDATIEEVANDGGLDMYADGSALSGANILFFTAPLSYGEKWSALLLAFQQFLRAKNSNDAKATLAALDAEFVEILTDRDAPPRMFLNIAHQGVTHLRSLSRLQLGESIDHRLRALDPLIPAVGAAVMFWSGKSDRPVEIVHDEAKELTPERASAMKRSLAAPEIVAPHRAGEGVELAGVSLVDSRFDQRVQVADLLAGLARVVGEAVLSGQEPPLLPLVEKHMSALSIWPSHALMDPKYARAVAKGAYRRDSTGRVRE